MRTWKILAIAALLTLAMWMSGCTVVHLHVGDTNIQDSAKASLGTALPVPRIVLPTPESTE